jgi:hypothetical protein
MAQLLTAILLLYVVVPLFVVHAQKQCSNFAFSRDINLKLKCGIFKTLFANPMQCQKECVATLSCFSINTYQSENGTEICELIKGSKNSFEMTACIVRKEGSEHNELTVSRL